jgi:hypothetical protein
VREIAGSPGLGALGGARRNMMLLSSLGELLFCSFKKAVEAASIAVRGNITLRSQTQLLVMLRERIGNEGIVSEVIIPRP